MPVSKPEKLTSAYISCLFRTLMSSNYSSQPEVEWKPCCSSKSRCVPVDDPADWGSRCTEEGEDSPGYIAGKCHPNGAKCVGAPNRPPVKWLPCCGGGQCIPHKGSWGKVCSRGRDIGQKDPPSDPTCHDTDVRCQGAPGFPFVQYKPCCKRGDECLPASDWGFKCQKAGSEGPHPTPNPSSAPEPSPTDPNPDPSPTDPHPDPSPTDPHPDPSPTDPAPGPCAGRSPVRKEVGDMSSGEWDNFVKAFKAVVAKRGSASRSPYESFTSSHAEGASLGHGTGYFLLWHRVMLYDFETELAREQPGVTLPYIDWSIRSGNNLMGERRIFNPDRFGAASNGPISSGSFIGLQNSVNAERRMRAVERRTGRAGPPVERAILDELLKVKEFQRFTETLEVIHGMLQFCWTVFFQYAMRRRVRCVLGLTAVCIFRFDIFLPQQALSTTLLAATCQTHSIALQTPSFMPITHLLTRRKYIALLYSKRKHFPKLESEHCQTQHQLIHFPHSCSLFQINPIEDMMTGKRFLETR